MASYGYEAINPQGKTIKGSMEADNEEQVRTKLKQQNNVPLSIKEQSALSKDINIDVGGKPTPRDMAVMCRQFVSMSRAGVSILDCLGLLWEQTENKKLSASLRKVQADVQKGETMADAMKKEKKIFPDLMITTVAAGESSGSLDKSLDRMGDQFEKAAKTRALVKKAMVYPIVVSIVAVIVVIVMLTVVIPQYTSMFADLGTDLPGITKAVVAASDFMIQKWYILLPIVIAIIVGLKVFFATEVGKEFKSVTALKIPIFKNLTEKSACSQLARTLSTLLSAGVPLVEAVEITANTMENLQYKKAMWNAKDEVIKGVPLSVPLEQSKLFPPMLYHMLRIGEESGNTEEMLIKLADYYDEEVEMATQSLMAAMEPMIILVLASIVGVLIAAVMAPMVTMYSALDNL